MKENTIRTVSINTGLPVPYSQIHIFQRGENYCMNEHIHEDFWHLNYIMDGNLKLFMNGNMIKINKNCFFAIPAGVPHEIVSENGYSQIGVDIYEKEDEHHVYQIISSVLDWSKPVPVAPPTQKFDVLFDMVKNPHMLNIVLFLNIYERIIIDAVRSELNKTKALSIKLSHIFSENNPLALSLKDICKLTNYSKTQLERLSKKELGCGITAYLNNIRLNEICILLQETEMTLAQIAESVGLCDAGHLTVFFKKYMGITPGKYRKNYQNSL